MDFSWTEKFENTKIKVLIKKNLIVIVQKNTTVLAFFTLAFYNLLLTT